MDPIIHVVQGRAIATCLRDASHGGCKQRTFLSGLLYLIEVKRVQDEVRTSTIGVRSCPRCNIYLDPKGIVLEDDEEAT